MTAPVFLGSGIYRGSSYGAWHPLRIPRVSTVMDLCRALGWFAPGQERTSPRARPATLKRWHTGAYVDALVAAERDGAVSEAVRRRHGLGTHANPVFPEMYRRPATAVGASILAGELLACGGIVHSPAGGTHHGFPDRASGFCYLNDPVFAILSLRANGAARVAYVDIDAHHPDGVFDGFRDDTDVMIVSVHEERRWPFTGEITERGAGETWNLPVPKGLNDTEFAACLDGLILPRVVAFRPDAIVLQCGADAVEEDPLSRLALSNDAHLRAVAALMPMSPRLLVLGGGGYNPWSVARCWTGVWAVLNGIDIPGRLPPEAEAVLRGLEWSGARAGRAPPGHWFTTLRDAPRPGPVRSEVRARIAQLADRARAWA